MYQSSWNPKYIIPDLAKYECRECESEFILSMKYANSKARCPYCQSKKIEAVVLLDDPRQLAELGCMAISL